MATEQLESPEIKQFTPEVNDVQPSDSNAAINCMEAEISEKLNANAVSGSPLEAESELYHQAELTLNMAVHVRQRRRTAP